MLNDPNSAMAASSFAGQFTLVVLMLAATIKCWTISRRPTTNTKCALSLMLLCVAFLITGTHAILSRFIPYIPANRVVAGILGLVIFGLIVTAIILAIIGLVEYSRHRESYNQGRSQAISALGLTVFMLIFGIQGAVTGYKRAHGFSNEKANELVKFEDLNFQFRTPGYPWKQYDASKINKASKLSLVRQFPEGYFTITAEKIGNLNFTSEQLAEAGKANMEVASTSHRVVNQTPYRVGSLDGVMVETEAQVGANSLHYRNWYVVTNGYAYQLIGFSRSEDQNVVKKQLDDLFTRFEVIDPGRMASTSGGFTTNFYSRDHHYSVQVKGSSWRPYSSSEGLFAQSEFAATQGDSCFVTMPIKLDGERPDLEALSSAYLATLDVAYPNENITNRRMVKDSGADALQFDYPREIHGRKYIYRLKISEHGDDANLVMAWTQREGEGAEGVLDDALDRVISVPVSNSVALVSMTETATKKELKTRSYILNQAGLYYTRQNEYEKALPLFRAAAKANSEQSLYIVNALLAWEHLDRPAEALEFLKWQPTSILVLPAVKTKRAYFQSQASDVDGAITNYQSVFASGYRDDESFTEYVSLLMEKKRYDAALEEVQNYLRPGSPVTIRMLEGEIYTRKKDYSKAADSLKKLRDENPFNAQVAEALVNNYLAAAQYSDALDICRDLAKDNKTAYVTFLKGRSELGLKWYREAKTDFAEASKLAPANKDYRSYLDYVSSMLGEGDNTATIDPIEPVAFPAEFTNAPTQPVPADYGKKYGAYYLRHLVAESYIPGKEIKNTDYILVQMLDASGVSAFSTIQVKFDPVTEAVFVNDLRVMDASGKTILTGDPANYYVLDDRRESSASQKKVLNIPVSGLQPNCQLTATITRRQLGPTDEFPFFDHYFSATFPERENIFFLANGADRVKYQSSPGIEPQKSSGGLYWRVTDPMVVRYESLQPPFTTFLPMLWLSDASAQWPALVKDYLTNIQDRLEKDPALDKQTQKLTAGLDNPDAKIAALSAYVQTNLSYKAIEFGRRARMPNKPADILRNKYGDCKDHSLLLQQMLADAGIPAQLALFNFVGPIQKNLPSLDQFDHMVVFVPGGGSNYFLDCTSKGASVAHAVPAYMAGRDVLVLDEHNPRFVTVPNFPGDASTVSVERHLHLAGTTDLAAEDTLTLRGDTAAVWRDYLLQISESGRRAWLQTQMGMTDAHVTDAKIDGLNTPDAPLRLTFGYSIKGQFRQSNDQLRGVLHGGFSRFYLQTTPADDRVSPFEIRTRYTLDSKTYLDLPAGFHLEPSEALHVKLDPRFATAQSDFQTRSNQMVLNFTYQQKNGHFAAADYAAYRDTIAQALSMLERDVVFMADKH